MVPDIIRLFCCLITGRVRDIRCPSRLFDAVMILTRLFGAISDCVFQMVVVLKYDGVFISEYEGDKMRRVLFEVIGIASI